MLFRYLPAVCKMSGPTSNEVGAGREISVERTCGLRGQADRFVELVGTE
jgi:hypothetical protein